MCYYDSDAETPQIFEQYRRVARKHHQCNECQRPIAPGEPYHLSKGLWDSEWSQFRACAHCQVAVAWLQAECGGYIFGQVEEDCAEHLQELVASVGLVRLVVGMRRQWARFHGDGLLPVPRIPRVSA